MISDLGCYLFGVMIFKLQNIFSIEPKQHVVISTFLRRTPQKNATKIDIYRGSYRMHILAYLNSLLIFLPSLEVLFFMNNYF